MGTPVGVLNREELDYSIGIINRVAEVYKATQW
jgi:hypothetical protein